MVKVGTSVRLPPDLDDALNQLTADGRTVRSQHIVSAVRDYVDVELPGHRHGRIGAGTADGLGDQVVRRLDGLCRAWEQRPIAGDQKQDVAALVQQMARIAMVLQQVGMVVEPDVGAVRHDLARDFSTSIAAIDAQSRALLTIARSITRSADAG